MSGCQSITPADLRQNNENKYQIVNSYTHKASLEQILTIFLFVLVTTLHNVFITTAIVAAKNPILWILLAITYVLLLIIGYDYLILTCKDPADDLLLGINKDYPRQQLKVCRICLIMVHKTSYHCHTCDRCVEYFDHHCKYLNNCIGGKNYSIFLRLLIIVTFYCLFIIGEGVWIFILGQNDSNYDSDIISKQGVLATIIITFGMMVAIDTLLCFHLYLIFNQKTTTFQYLQDKSATTLNKDSSKQRIDETP